MANLPTNKNSLIADLMQQLSADDPDFGKVRNDVPSNEFAFELRGNPIVPTIKVMSEGCTDLGISAVSDYGQAVTTVPIGATSNSFLFDLASHSIELKTELVELPIENLMHALSRGIVDLIECLDLPPRRKEKLKLLRMSRFYYSSPDPWWTFTHG